MVSTRKNNARDATHQRGQTVSKKTRKCAMCAPRERRRPLSMAPLRTSWQLERSISSLGGKKSDLETALKWSERSGSASWWKMSSLVPLKTWAKVKAKAKSLNMTALKNVKKLLESGLSAPNPRKQLRPNMCLSFRTLILELFKALGDWKKWSSSGCTFSGTPKRVHDVSPRVSSWLLAGRQPLSHYISTSFFACSHEPTIHTAASRAFVCVPCVRGLILEQRYYGAQCHETQRKRENIGSLESLCDEDLWERHCRVAFWELVVCRTLALQTYWTFEMPF